MSMPWRGKGDWRWVAATLLLAALVIGLGFVLRAKGLGTAANVAQLVSLAPLVVGLANWPRAAQPAARYRERDPLARLGRELSVITYAEERRTGHDVRDRLAGFDKDDINAYLSGTRLPGWDFIVALMDAVTYGDRGHRELLEQRLRPWWEAADAARSHGRRAQAAASTFADTSRNERPLLRSPVLIAGGAITALTAAAALAIFLSTLIPGSGAGSHPGLRLITPHRIAILASPQDNRGSFIKVAFSPGGNTLAVGELNGGNIYLWDLKTHKVVKALTEPGNAAVLSVAFSPDGTTLATGDEAGKAYLWDLKNYQIIATLANTKKLWVFSLAFSPTGRNLATGERGGDISIWNLKTNNVTIALHDPNNSDVYSVAFSNDEASLAAGPYTGSTYLWSLKTSHVIDILNDPDSSGVYSVSFTPDGTALAAGDTNGSTYLWSLNTRKANATLTNPGTHPEVTSIAISPDGSVLAAGDGSGSTYLWSMDTHKIVAAIPTSNDTSVESVAFSSDGTTLAISALTGTTYLWDLKDRSYG